MKFLIFNIAVVAALGYILIQEGYLDKRVIDDLAGKASAIAEKPDKTERPDMAERAAEPPTPVRAQTAQKLAEASAGQAEPEPLKAQPVETPPVFAPPPDAEIPSRPAIPATVKPPPADLSPEVASRRADVLDEGPVSAAPPPLAEDRRNRLHALAEEMETLSIDLMYQ